MNQAAIAAHFPVVNRYRGNLTPMPSLFRTQRLHGSSPKVIF
jgi:hypothetical protein